MKTTRTLLVLTVLVLSTLLFSCNTIHARGGSSVYGKGGDGIRDSTIHQTNDTKVDGTVSAHLK
ncbi:MAG: hypothetical protein U1E76_07015 [Planctomycetota bacterium]